PTMEAIVEERAPLHRPIDSDDVGAAAAFLLSDEADNITCTTLYVDSGYHAMGMYRCRPPSGGLTLKNRAPEDDVCAHERLSAGRSPVPPCLDTLDRPLGRGLQ